MSYLIILCVVAVEALNLALLRIALRGSVSRVVRPLLAGSGLSGAWGAWILVLVLRGPLSMLALTGSVFAVSSVVMGMAIHLALVDGVDREGGSDGGAATDGPEGLDGGGSGEPVWWPEFQRQMDAYAARRDRERQLVDR